MGLKTTDIDIQEFREIFLNQNDMVRFFETLIELELTHLQEKFSDTKNVISRPILKVLT